MAVSRCSLLMSTSVRWCVFGGRRAILAFGGHSVTMLSRPVSVCAAMRLTNSKVIDTPVLADVGSEKAYRYAQYKLNRNIVGRFWDWLTSDPADNEPEMTEREKKERSDLLSRVEAMYFTDPPIQPNLDFYKEVFQTLVKYEDSVGCVTLWRVMKELGVQPDAELKQLVEPFLEKAQRESWY